MITAVALVCCHALSTSMAPTAAAARAAAVAAAMPLSAAVAAAEPTAEGTPRAGPSDSEDWDSYGHGADNVAYWDTVYRVQGAAGRQTYEWYALGYKELAAQLELVLVPEGRVLVVGSGDSELSYDLSLTGREITNVDFSAEANDRMRQRHPELTWLTLDARRMSFTDGHFDAVIDKGLSDCIETRDDMIVYLRELRRVVKDGNGVVVVISMNPVSDDAKLTAGLACQEPLEFKGPLFQEVHETLPPQPIPGTSGIPYLFMVCAPSAEAPPPLGNLEL